MLFAKRPCRYQRPAAHTAIFRSRSKFISVVCNPREVPCVLHCIGIIIGIINIACTSAQMREPELEKESAKERERDKRERARERDHQGRRGIPSACPNNTFGYRNRCRTELSQTMLKEGSINVVQSTAGRHCVCRQNDKQHPHGAQLHRLLPSTSKRFPKFSFQQRQERWRRRFRFLHQIKGTFSVVRNYQVVKGA